MNIDVDSHFTPPEIFDNIPLEYDDAPRWVTGNDGKRALWVKSVERWIRFDKSSYDLKMRMDAMKEGGYDKQCLNSALHTIPIPYVSPKTELYLVKAWNDAVAKIVQENDCFIGVAQLPHRDVDAAIEEADRAVKDLGFSALHIEGNWAGKNIESYEWWPFFEKIEKLGVPIFSHPTGNASEYYFNPNMPAKAQLELLPGDVSQLFAFLVLHQISMTGLIFLGVLDRFPGLKFVWLETEVGWVPGFMDLLDSYYDAHLFCKAQGILKYLQCKCPVESIALKKKPSQYFRDNFYVTTSGMFWEPPLKFVCSVLGSDKVLFAADYPYESNKLAVEFIEAASLSASDKANVCHRNAERILRL